MTKVKTAMQPKHQTVIIEYLPNYKVKFTCRLKEITEDEGGGWYSVVGHEPACYTSRIKHLSQIPDKVVSIDELTVENKVVFEREKTLFENSKMHKDWLKTFEKLLNSQTFQNQ